MLVLSRQRDESIIINDDIIITVVDIRGDKVRLGINAPSEIPIHRREVYEAIQKANQLEDRTGLGGSIRADLDKRYVHRIYESPQLPGENYRY